SHATARGLSSMIRAPRGSTKSGPRGREPIGIAPPRGPRRVPRGVDKDRTSVAIGCSFLAHATGFEFFTRAAWAGIVPPHLFSKVPDWLALRLARPLAGGNRRFLLAPDARAGDGRQLRGSLLMDRLRPIEARGSIAKIGEECGVELIDSKDQV